MRRITRLLSLAITATLNMIPAMNSAAETGDTSAAHNNVFWSGHSLTDPPIPQMLASISAGFGTPMQWNRHSMAGGSLEARTRGRPANPDGWDGYHQGNNRDTVDMDVIGELQGGTSIGGERYATLIVTEVHSFLYSLLRGDTVRLLRHYHERFLAGNPAGQTWLYQAWLDVTDKSDPRAWIAYETAAAPVWQCIATRVNTSLAAEHRRDRIAFLPAGQALVHLLERAIDDAGVPGITGADNTATVNRLLRDNVHLTDTGAYYIALVVHAFTTGSSPLGAWAPAGMSAAQATALQQIAWEFRNTYERDSVPLSLDDCSTLVREDFAAEFWRYELARQLNFDIPWYEKLWKQATYDGRVARNTAEWQAAFAAESADNPFNFNAATDAGIWHPAP